MQVIASTESSSKIQLEMFELDLKGEADLSINVGEELLEEETAEAKLRGPKHGKHLGINT